MTHEEHKKQIITEIGTVCDAATRAIEKECGPLHQHYLRLVAALERLDGPVAAPHGVYSFQSWLIALAQGLGGRRL